MTLDGTDRLAQYLKGLPNAEKLFAALKPQSDALRQTFSDLKLLRTLAAAEGAQLDVIGKILGLARAEGVSDSTYRAQLQQKVAINRSSGTCEDLLFLVTSISSTAIPRLFPLNYNLTQSCEPGLGEFVLALQADDYRGGLSTALFITLLIGLYATHPAGTYGVLQYVEVGGDSSFVLDGTGASPDTDLDGGKLATAFSIDQIPAILATLH